MARKKKNEVVEETVVAEPIEVAPAMPVEAPVEPKKWIVNCHRCGASVYVYVGDMVYMCPVCNNLFRVRKCEKLVKDITRNIVAEAYVNVHKGKDEE